MSSPTTSPAKTPKLNPPPARHCASSTSERSGAMYMLCVTILCERWAAFTLISTAAAMLCERYGLSRADSLRLWGLVSALCYIGSVPGGYLLDRRFSPSLGLIGGSLLLLLGYVSLTIPYRVAAFIGFGLLALGQSLYKPSTQRVLHAIFPSKGSRSEQAQVALHIAINIGAAAGSFCAGLLVRHAGWSVTFAISALITGIGIAVSHSLHRASQATHFSSENDSNGDATKHTPFHLPSTISLLSAMFLLTLSTAQIERSLILWTTQHIDRIVFRFEIPTAWLVTYAAILVFCLSPIQLALMKRQRRRSLSLRHIAYGLLCAALCFAVLLPSVFLSNRAGIGWPILSVSLFVLAELLIAPLGLALLHRSTPSRLSGIISGCGTVPVRSAISSVDSSVRSGPSGLRSESSPC
ncbi:MAG: MFS transporter [Myxococcales bacterium]|nr:MFS transporter [Myxococcales bacterium]